MLQKMKNQLKESINSAKESGELTVQNIYEITHDGVSKGMLNLRSGVRDLREISWEVIATTIQSLKETGQASEKNIAAAIHGTVDGIKQVESEMLDKTHQELTQSKKKVQQEEEKLAEAMNEVFEGVKKAAADSTGEIKTNIETALVDAKLKSTELLGLTQDTVKEAVRKAIESGEDVEETIVKVTRDATEKALSETPFSAERVRKVSESVLAAALDAAEDPISTIKETTSAAVEGVRQGLTRSINFIRESFANADDSIKKFVAEDLQQTKDDLEAVEDIFVETLRKAADKSENAAKDILYELADDSKKAGSSLRENVLAASHSIDKHLKEIGTGTVHKTEDLGHKAADQTKVLSDRMVSVAKGAASGMFEGAKKAFHKTDGENTGDKS